MAVRPYIGAIVEPDNRKLSRSSSYFNSSSLDPPVNPAKPDTIYNLDYVYGYRCADSRQNVFYNSNGQAVYMTAALGVILD